MDKFLKTVGAIFLVVWTILGVIFLVSTIIPLVMAGRGASVPITPQTTSQSPTLDDKTKSCMEGILGKDKVDAIVNGQAPSQDEIAKIEPCFTSPAESTPASQPNPVPPVK